jgi:hypothetical protein
MLELTHSFHRGYTLQQVGAYFGVSYAPVGRAVKALEGSVFCKD